MLNESKATEGHVHTNECIRRPPGCDLPDASKDTEHEQAALEGAIMDNRFASSVQVHNIGIADAHFAAGWMARKRWETEQSQDDLPLSKETAKKVADWLSQTISGLDVEEGGYVKLHDVVAALDKVGDDSLWFKGEEWGEIVRKAALYDETVQAERRISTDEALAIRTAIEKRLERYGLTFDLVEVRQWLHAGGIIVNGD